jgi:RHS repeat-associated protein
MITTQQLSENSHQGLEGLKAALCLGSTAVKSNTASEMQLRLRQNSIGSRSSGKERDAETGLDFFEARYFSSPEGRFMSPDPFNIIFEAKDENDFASFIAQPQNWNKYVYTLNNPLRYVDPTGERIELIGNEEERNTALAYLCNIVRCKDKLKLKAVDDGTGHYYVEIDGNISDFMNMNKEAYYLASLIGDSATVEFGITTEKDLSSWGGAATCRPGERLCGNNVRVLVNPEQIWIGDRNLNSSIGQLKFGGHGKFDIPNWRIRSLTMEMTIWHEFGHAWGKIHGRLLEPLSDMEAVGWENMIRQLQFGPLGPKNAPRLRH